MSALDRCDLRSRVQQALAGFLATRRTGLADMSPELLPLADAVQDLVTDGKRLRPAFCFWGAVGAGGTDADALVTAAAALELFQAAALVHDDVMDGSDTRRGRPAAHRRFAGLHLEQRWNGSPDAFGAGAAILLGDLCLVWSGAMLESSGLLDATARRIFDAMRAEVMGGQYLDLLEQARGDSTVESALTVARFKSAKYTVVEPLHLGGALVAGGSDRTAVYTAYGFPLGEAFQLRDDLLGVFGDPSVTGKPAGDDLREGKRTALVAMTLEAADHRQAALVRRHLGQADLDSAGVEALRTVIVETGAVARVESLIERRTAEALSALDGTSLDGGADEVLRELAVAATRRQT